MAAVAKKSMKRLISRTISVQDVPKTARPVLARSDGMLPQLLRKIRALPKGMTEEVDFDSKQQAANVCNKVRQYAKKHAGLQVEARMQVLRDGTAVCYFSRGDLV